jgi:hypothetical protein
VILSLAGPWASLQEIYIFEALAFFLADQDYGNHHGKTKAQREWQFSQCTPFSSEQEGQTGRSLN